MGSAKYLVIGGGLAAVNAAATIRERDADGSITIVADENYLPYDRVPLSKGYLLGKAKRENLFPKKAPFYEQMKILVLTGRKVISINTGLRSARLDDASEVAFEKALIATGGRPRTLSLQGSELEGVYYFRTIDDCERLKSKMGELKSVVIVGGGFIGCEIAAALTERNVATTVLEVLPSILRLAFDPDTAKWIEDYFIGKGVKILTNTGASQFVGEGGHVTAVMTNDGRLLPADLVLVGVGIVPNSEIAEAAGIRVENGVLVDEHLETSVAGVFAAGDVARFNHPVFGHRMRLEHYDIAVKHGKIAGANMAGANEAFRDVPHFFSFLFDLTIHAYGDMSRRDQTITRGELSSKSFFQFIFAEGVLRALLAVNKPFAEINVAKSILQVQPTVESLRTISDPGKSLQSFAPQASS